jgi:hypothetical protein
MKTLKGCEEMRRREAEKANNPSPETPASGAEILTCKGRIGALVEDMEREEEAAWVAAREADRKDDSKEYSKQLAIARTWQAAVRKLRSTNVTRATPPGSLE